MRTALARRDAQHPWQLDLQLDRSTSEWTYKRDARIRVPWERALHTGNGIPYQRPEIALLHKAHLDRSKDWADLAAARLDPDARARLANTLEQLGYHTWAQLARTGAGHERGHTPKRQRVSQRHSRIVGSHRPGSASSLAMPEVAPPIFQAGHEGSIPFARSNQKAQVYRPH